MQRFSVFLLMLFVCVNANAGAGLPVVDVTSGRVSARAAFGEDIAQQKSVRVEPVKKKSTRNVVARSAKKSVDVKVAQSDVLKPKRPSSDLWAKNEPVLRMPRMDEINVVRSDDLLPEENLDSRPVFVAKKSEKANVTENQDIKAELDVLRAEVNRLSQLQQKTEKVALARPVSVRTPITGEAKVKSANKVNVRREIVPMETKQEVAVRSGIPNTEEPKMASVSKSNKLSPNELKKAFKKTYLSENKHLSTYAAVADRYDVASETESDVQGFSAEMDLSESYDGVRPLEIKISFLNGDSSLSRENYTLLSETASIVVNNPKRAIQVAIPESVMTNKDARKLAARRLAIVEQVLRDTGIAEQRIVPVLSQRNDDSFVLRIISGDLFETLTEQKRNMFGDSISKKTYKSMSW
ncbi:MAG: hypothetical protein IKN73_00850 [Alphaproteobacteria bacterium]|nr:hypothetical protein [Alphaproteobacteria bacterium]